MIGGNRIQTNPSNADRSVLNVYPYPDSLNQTDTILQSNSICSSYFVFRRMLLFLKWKLTLLFPLCLPLSRHGEVEGVEAPGDLELSADAGHAVQLGVVSVPQGRDPRVTPSARSRRQIVRMRERRVVVSEVRRGQRQQRPGGRQHPRRRH